MLRNVISSQPFAHKRAVTPFLTSETQKETFNWRKAPANLFCTTNPDMSMQMEKFCRHLQHINRKSTEKPRNRNSRIFVRLFSTCGRPVWCFCAHNDLIENAYAPTANRFKSDEKSFWRDRFVCFIYLSLSLGCGAFAYLSAEHDSCSC